MQEILRLLSNALMFFYALHEVFLITRLSNVLSGIHANVFMLQLLKRICKQRCLHFSGVYFLGYFT